MLAALQFHLSLSATLTVLFRHAVAQGKKLYYAVHKVGNTRGCSSSCCVAPVGFAECERLSGKPRQLAVHAAWLAHAMGPCLGSHLFMRHGS